MNEVLIVVIAVLVVTGGAALVYFLLKKYFSAESADSKTNASQDRKAEKAKVAAEKKAAGEKRKAEMMKKTVMEADPKVLQHRFIQKAADEISKNPRAIAQIVVMANRIDWTSKEEYNREASGNVFFDDPSLSRLEQGEMKLVAEHLYNIVKNMGFELEEVGSGEEGTYRYHIDKYVIKAL